MIDFSCIFDDGDFFADYTVVRSGGPPVKIDFELVSPEPINVIVSMYLRPANMSKLTSYGTGFGDAVYLEATTKDKLFMYSGDQISDQVVYNGVYFKVVGRRESAMTNINRYLLVVV